MPRGSTVVLVFAALAFHPAVAGAQGRDFSKVEIKTTKVAEDIYMLEGAGGNIGVCVGRRACW